MYRLLLILSTLLLTAFSLKKDTAVTVFSLEFNSKMIENKKYINVEGEVYFKRDNNLMVTHIKKPFETVTILNANGDMKVYNYESNTITLTSNILNSSEQSYFWYYLTGNYHDMGLSKTGYTMTDTKIEDGAIVTYWGPKPGNISYIKKIIIATENNLPIYEEFQADKGKIKGKIFFANYTKIGDILLPLKITEIFYGLKKDSSINIKQYFNPKINKEVSLEYLNFKIPSNAKTFHKK